MNHHPRRALAALGLTALMSALSACQIADGVPRVKVRFEQAVEHVAPADSPAPTTTMYAPIPEPKTPCDEHRVEQPELPGCYVPVPYEAAP